MVDGAGRVVRLAASVCLSDMHIPTVFLLLYGGSMLQKRNQVLKLKAKGVLCGRSLS